MTRCSVFKIILVTVLTLALSAGLAFAKKPGSVSSTGTGRVFFPNPVATLQDQTLTDQKDADYATLQPAYRLVTLTNLDGSGYLRGDWANITSTTGAPAYSATNSFLYNRHDDQFEQVMAYYWITKAQLYIQSLGFGVSRRPINRESQNVKIDQWGLDNSYSWDKHDVMRFGKGGVDDAEDAEVILHEYGHAMMDSQADPFGTFGYTFESGAIGEGFSDYWAVEVTNLFAPTPDPACVAEWDSVEYTSAPHCLRRIDKEFHYPEDLRGEVHWDGMIWSRALWAIRLELGSTVADTVILESHFSYAPDTTMPAAALVVVETAEALYGAATAQAVLDAFADRGILEL